MAEIVAAFGRCDTTEYLAWLEARVGATPQCAISRYLLGCQYFDRGRTAQAVRQMMTAHHLEPCLESAALLVFSGLNLIRQRSGTMLSVLLETWTEYGKPPFDRFSGERHVLDAFVERSDAIANASPLARRLWRLPIRLLRRELVAAVASADARQYSLLLAPA